jgi:hypothetical protein
MRKMVRHGRFLSDDCVILLDFRRNMGEMFMHRWVSKLYMGINGVLN